MSVDQSAIAPVRAITGTPQVVSIDVQSNAFGMTWGHSRKWNGLNDASLNGNGWSVTDLPYLVVQANQTFGQHIGVVSLYEGGQASRQFLYDFDTHTLTPQFTDTSSLVYVPPTVDGSSNKIPGEFHLTDPEGNLLVFYDLPRQEYANSDPGLIYVERDGRLYQGNGYAQEPTNQWFDTSTGTRYDGGSGTAAKYRFGALKSYTSASGTLTISTTYDTDGNLTQSVRTDGSGKYERLHYEYTTLTNSLGGSATVLDKVSLQQGTSPTGSWTTIQSSEYSYYTGTVGDDTDKYGRLGDLKTATIKDAGGNVTDRRYYRYTKLYGNGILNLDGYDRRGPTNDMDITGGNDTDFTEQDGDQYVQSGLKSVFEGAAFARLAANRGDVSSFQNDSDTDVNAYANLVFSYARSNYGDADYPYAFPGETIYRATDEVASGVGCSTCSSGFGTFKYEYTAGHLAAAVSSTYRYPNDWSVKFTQYLPDTTPSDWTDNDQEIDYTNDAGEFLLKVLIDKNGTSDTGDDRQFITAMQYDDNYRLIQVAQPSAVMTYDETRGDLVDWSPSFDQNINLSRGLIDRFEYADTTTATSTTAGDVEGHLMAHYVRQGNNGDETLVGSQTYYAHADGITGAIVYPVASTSGHWDIDRDSDDDAVTSVYTYTWRKDAGTNTYDTNQVLSTTVTHPTVATGRNGSGSATSVVTVFDADNRPTWVKDEAGFINYTAYDDVTGTPTKQIVDVDTSQTGTFANKPSGWSTPTGGGAHLTTTWSVDVQGRPTLETDPNGNKTYTVYLDANHEVRTYRSGSGSFSQVGPIGIARDYWPGVSASSGQRTVYSETITSSATPSLTSGVPNGSETIDSSNIQSLSRQATNDAGQVTQSYDFFNLSGVTYAAATVALGTLNTNYYLTKLDYDSRGRQKRVETPTGTITRYLYDTRNLPTQTWVGTDDTPTSGYWSPSNTGGTNLTLVQENVYDGWRRSGEDPPKPPTLSQTESGSLPARTYYVKISYTNFYGETLPSAETTIQVDAGFVLFVTAPDDAPPGVTNTDIYVSETPGDETLQGSTGATGNWQEPDTGLITGDTPPTPTHIGDGLLTATTIHPSGSTDASTDRTTLFYYDSRDRLVATKTGARLDASGAEDVLNESADTQSQISYFDLDTAGHVTATSTFDGDNVPVTITAGKPDKPDSSLLRGYSETFFDDWSRVYQSKVFSVDPTSGSVSTYALTAGTWYDERGNPIKVSSPGGLVSKFAYDGVSRQIKSFTTDGGGDSGYGDADDVTGDKVLEQSAVVYDGNGNVTLSTVKQRFHDATDTGELGDPSSSSGTAKARVYYTANYYDAADRLTATVDVGTNPVSGTPTAYSRPGSVPSRSDSAHVTSLTYAADGGVQDVTDPRGIVTRSSRDLLGRTTQTIEALTDYGTNDFHPTDSTNRTTNYLYDGDDHVTAMTADLPSGQNDQTTAYIYGVTTSGGSGLNSNDLLKEIRYPDKSAGTAGTSSSDKKQYLYSAVGDVTQLTDQNGNVHQFAYDVQGRQTADAVTTLGTGVDGAVRRLETAYNTQGIAYLFTSYDAASSGTVVNQVQDVFNGLGQLTTEYQSHSGAVNTSTTPKVQYAYTEMASGANHSRLTSMTYVNGRKLRYEYSSGLDSNISRISFLADDSSGSVGTHLEEYSYLGLGTIVRMARPEPGTELTYIGGTPADAGDKYVSLDRFGQVADQRWMTTSGSMDLDRFQYAYDRDGNPLYKKNTVDTTKSELYHASSSTSGDEQSGYDKLNRLTGFSRGTLTSSGNNGVSGAGLDTISTGNLSALTGATRTWTLDALGNQTATSTDGTSTSRTHDSRNEVTGVGSNTLTFDNAGNMTMDETGKKFQYDAWNRLVGLDANADNDVTDTGDETYRYDPLGRRILGTPVSGTATDSYFDTNWQEIEQQQSGTTKIQNIFGLTYVDDLLLRDRDGDNSSGTGNYGKGGSGLEERLYAQHDANHNVTSITNASGTVQQRCVSDAYGKFTVLGSNWTMTTDAYAWMRLHQGLAYLPELGMFDSRARFYSPNLGRFAQMDPAGYVDGANEYNGYGANPVNRLDPAGLWDATGHFWTAYMVAVAAGKAPTEAYEIAYYAQLPDQVGDFDATNQWSIVYGPPNKGYSPNQPFITWANDVFFWLHSLTGENYPCMAKRRTVLKSMITAGKLETWELGFLIHAYGDAFAHTKSDGSAYGPRWGHLAAAHVPDSVQENPGKYKDYVNGLYSALGGDKNGNRNQLDALLSFANGKGDDFDAMKAFARSNFQYTFPYIPKPWRAIPRKFYTPSKSQVSRLFIKIRDAEILFGPPKCEVPKVQELSPEQEYNLLRAFGGGTPNAY